MDGCVANLDTNGCRAGLLKDKVVDYTSEIVVELLSRLRPSCPGVAHKDN